MISTVAILGGHIQALGLARQVKQGGLRTIIIGDDKCSVARWSRSVDEVHFYSTREELIAIIESLAINTMLFPTSDDYIELMLAHHQAWKERLYLAIPEPETVELFADKRKTYQFCEKNDIAHPKSFYPDTIADIETIASKVSYPCVIKPAVMYSFHKLLGKKAFLISSPDELRSKMEMIVKAGFPIAQLIVQEFLSGGAKTLYSFGTFAVNGESLVDIQVNRIRQNPMTFGNSTTFCHTVEIPEIAQAAKRILCQTNYTGMGEVEFMYDHGQYKFLEINTRAWKWHTISNQQGFSFIGTWIKYLNRQDLSTSQSRGNDAAWVERLTDTAVAAKEILHRRISLGQYLKTMCRSKESAVWSWRDPLPAIMYVLLSPLLYIKRY